MVSVEADEHILLHHLTVLFLDEPSPGDKVLVTRRYLIEDNQEDRGEHNGGCAELDLPQSYLVFI